VITDLALLGFDEETGRLRLDALQPGVSEEQVQAATGFELLRSDTLSQLSAPTKLELSELRRLRGDADSSELGAQREATQAS
jgi:glutaconate CoA-transferase subunit B